MGFVETVRIRRRITFSLALLVCLALLSAVPSCGNAASRKVSRGKLNSKSSDDSNSEQVLVAVMSPSRQADAKTTKNDSPKKAVGAATDAAGKGSKPASRKKKKKKKKKKKPSTEMAAPSPVRQSVLVQLQPNNHDFAEQCVGTLSVVTVTVVNLDSKSSLNLNSLAGSSTHFHASSFVSKVVAVKNSTNFRVAFLPRGIGHVQANFSLRTSMGDIPYTVSGTGVESPYQVRPFVGIRVPVNITYQPLISIHNPYSSTMQVVEMYTSGGNLNLEFPGSKPKVNSQAWEVGAYETKTLMRAQYVGTETRNFTGYIRIRLRHQEAKNETLVLPVEVEVTNATGLFCTVETLDFGTVRNLDEPRNLSLSLLNSGTNPVRIRGVTANPPLPALAIHFTPTVLKSRRRYSKVASLVFSASQCERCGYVRGTVEVVATDGERSMHLNIPFRARVLDGTLQYSMSLTSFRVTGPPYYPIVHSFPLTNTFNSTIVILDARFPQEVKGLLSINDFRPPVVVSPHQSLTPFSIYFLSNSSDISLTTALRVVTNASVFAIPFQCYNGQLKIIHESTSNGSVDFGIIGADEPHSKTFRVANSNPVEVMIKKIAVSIKRTKIKLVSLRSLKSGSLRRIALATKSVAIPGQHEATFAVELKSPLKEGHVEGNITVKTQLQTLLVPLKYQAVPGALRTIPQNLVLPPAFPGIVGTLQLRMRSLFKQDLSVLSLKPEVDDPRFQFELAPGHLVLSDKAVHVGTLYFNPLVDGSAQHYVGVGAKGTTSRLVWLQNILKDGFQPDGDVHDYEVMRDRWAAIQEAGRALTSPNATFLLNTDLVKNYRLTFQASLTWPSISQETTLQLPLTHVGKEAVAELRVHNPSNTRLVVQLIMLHDYPEPQRILDVLSDRLDTDDIDIEGSRNTFLLKEARPDPTIGAANTVILVLQANESSQIKIGFKPNMEKRFSSLVLLKNNLTVLDAVQLTGNGIVGSMTVNGQPCNGPSSLVFAMSTSLAEQCTKTTRPLQLQRTVVAHNTGVLPLHIIGMFINDKECDGYGFTVNNCRRFVLKPNATRSLRITFTPDFSMSRVQRKLHFNVKEIGHMSVSLVGTIPREVLPTCFQHLPRPWWENFMTRCHLLAAIALVIVISLFAYVSAGKTVARSLSGPPSGLQEVFDLRTASLRRHKPSNGSSSEDSDSSRRAVPGNATSASAAATSVSDSEPIRTPAVEPITTKKATTTGNARTGRLSPRPPARKGHAPSPAASPGASTAGGRVESTPATSGGSFTSNGSVTAALQSPSSVSPNMNKRSAALCRTSSVDSTDAGVSTSLSKFSKAATAYSTAVSSTSSVNASSAVLVSCGTQQHPLTAASSASSGAISKKPQKSKKQGTPTAITPTAEPRPRLEAHLSSESLSSNEAAATSPVSESGSSADKKAAACAKKTKTMLREEKREQRRQRDRERMKALKSMPAGAGCAAAVASDIQPVDGLDILLSSVERDSSVKPPKPAKSSKPSVQVAVVKPGIPRPAPAAAAESVDANSKFEASKVNAEPPSISTTPAGQSDSPPPSRPSRLFKPSAVPPSNSLAPAEAAKGPSSPHEMASAIALRVGLVEGKAGKKQPKPTPNSMAVSKGERDVGTKRSEPLLPLPDGKASASAPMAGKSSSEVFRRYKDNPSVQPEEFKPRGVSTLSASSSTSPSPVLFSGSPHALQRSTSPPVGMHSSSASGSSSVWSNGSPLTSSKLQQSPRRAPASAMSLSAAATTTKATTAPNPNLPSPPGLDFSDGMSPSSPLPLVYSHASIEMMAMQTAMGAALPPANADIFTVDNLPSSVKQRPALVAAASALPPSPKVCSRSFSPQVQLTLPSPEEPWSALRADSGSDSAGSTSPAWDSPNEAVGFETLAEDSLAFQHERLNNLALPMPSHNAARHSSKAKSKSESKSADTVGTSLGFATADHASPACGAWSDSRVSSQPVEASALDDALSWTTTSASLAADKSSPFLPVRSTVSTSSSFGTSGSSSSSNPGPNTSMWPTSSEASTSAPQRSSVWDDANLSGSRPAAGSGSRDTSAAAAASGTSPHRGANAFSSFHPVESTPISSDAPSSRPPTGHRQMARSPGDSLDLSTPYILPDIQRIWGSGGSSDLASGPIGSRGTAFRPAPSAIGTGLPSRAAAPASEPQPDMEEPAEASSETYYNPFHSNIWGFQASIFKKPDQQS